MLGFASGQFGAGPMSDRYGRRPLLLAGLAAYCVAAFGSALAGSIGVLIALQAAQGVAAGTCAVLAFATIRDLFEGDAARSKRSYVTVVFGLAPMLAPSLGALLLGTTGWRSIFLSLGAAGFLLLVTVALGVVESRPVGLPQVSVKPFAAYGIVLRDRRFTGLTIVNALSYGGMFAYIAGSPLVIMGSLGLPARVYAGFFACTAASLTAGAWVSGRCAAARIPPGRLLWLGLAGAAATSMTLCVSILLGFATLMLAVPLLLLNLFCRGLVAPNTQHMALEPLRENAGTAAAALGVIQILTGAVSSALVASLVPRLGPLGMTSVMAVLAVTSLASKKRRNRSS
jgi:DHA1 family bicyclomycin/chloramphenicol resistance-like MFS transporter